MQELFFSVDLFTSTAPAHSRHCLICCGYCTNDYIPTINVWAPSPLAKLTMKRVKTKIALMARDESADVLQQLLG